MCVCVVNASQLVQFDAEAKCVVVCALLSPVCTCMYIYVCTVGHVHVCTYMCVLYSGCGLTQGGKYCSSVAAGVLTPIYILTDRGLVDRPLYVQCSTV